MQSPLILAAKYSAKRETLQNYLIAGVAGVIIGAMLALSI